MKFLSFGKLFALLMLISYSVVAKSTLNKEEFQNEPKETFSNSADRIHKDMLQTQLVQITAMPDHSVKLVNPTFGLVPYGEKTQLLSPSTAKTTLNLQDSDRCESVSRFLFPYHFFW